MWIALAAGILYGVFSMTSRMVSTPAYVPMSDWKWWPRGFWAGRPIAPHAGYPGVLPPLPGPHDAPQFPAHGPITPGPLSQPGSLP